MIRYSSFSHKAEWVVPRHDEHWLLIAFTLLQLGDFWKPVGASCACYCDNLDKCVKLGNLSARGKSIIVSVKGKLNSLESCHKHESQKKWLGKL